MKINNKTSFSELLLWTNKTVLEVSILCGKSERTIKQYIKNNKPCKACKTLLIWLHFGIPQVNKWNNWKLRNGKLESPSGYEYEARHLEMLPVLYEWYQTQENDYKKRKVKAHAEIKKMAYFDLKK